MIGRFEAPPERAHGTNVNGNDLQRYFAWKNARYSPRGLGTGCTSVMTVTGMPPSTSPAAS
jgi:hypothetical protein